MARDDDDGSGSLPTVTANDPASNLAATDVRADLDGAGDDGATKASWKTWHTWLTVAFVTISMAAIAGVVIKLPYYTYSPGSALNLDPRVSVDGARTYPAKGELFLLFVNQNARINVWQWLQASFDPDIDLVKEKAVTGGRTISEVREDGDHEMAMSQLAAKKEALEAAGYTVPIDPGVLVVSTFIGLPAHDVLQPGDIILTLDGGPVADIDALVNVVQQHERGERIPITWRRDGKEHHGEVGVGADENGRPLLGITPAPNYDFPVDISIDTSNIGGPSAGLAMTLEIVDKLTPGDLTGGLNVAVTGTIDADGNVGEIGGISQKAVAARRAHAQLFLVPKCADTSPDSPCERGIARAKERIGDAPIVPVGSLDEALRALEKAGGEPVRRVGNTTAPIDHP
jgi:PDZ domain-containing protein